MAVPLKSEVHVIFQTFADADVTRRFISVVEVQILVASANAVTPAPLPSICSTPVVEHKTKAVDAFNSPITMEDTGCALYVFKNPARRESSTLR